MPIIFLMKRDVDNRKTALETIKGPLRANKTLGANLA